MVLYLNPFLKRVQFGMRSYPTLIRDLDEQSMNTQGVNVAYIVHIHVVKNNNTYPISLSGDKVGLCPDSADVQTVLKHN